MKSPVVADYLTLMDDSVVAILPQALRIADELGVRAALADGVRFSAMA